jgi:tetratricopeptide (TPR) repeat protein
MVPAEFMVTIKKWVQLGLLVCLAAYWQSCVPPGPAALLRGERQLKAGDYPGAIESLTEAVKLLPNLPQAWNHLGLAYHHSQKLAEASQSYRKALDLDYRLASARFNLGSLLLEFNQVRAAANEFATYTELKPELPGGWVRRGIAEWRANQWETARASLQQALRLNANQPDVWNALGMIELYRKNAVGAQHAFKQSLTQKRDHAPSLYNLALVSHYYLPRQPVDHREFALRTYRAYLSLPDRPLFTDTIQLVADRLDRELHPRAPEPKPEPKPEPAPAVPEPAPKPEPPPVDTTQPKPEPKPEEPAPTRPQPDPATNAPVKIVKTEPAKPLEAVKPAGELKPEPARNLVAPVVETVVPKVDPVAPVIVDIEPRPVVFVPDPPRAPINPRIAMRSTGITTGETPAPSFPRATSPPAPAISTQPIASNFRGLRYSYLNPRPPSSGFRHKAISHFDDGRRWQRLTRHDDAITAYRQAIKWDGAFFEAYHNLGLAATKANDFLRAAVAFETALALKPSSSKTRFHFADLLNNRGYHLDAAIELQKVVAEDPDDANAHLLLANISDQKLGQPASAAPHYREVLRIAPSHAQGTKIRYWLRSH